MKRMMIGCLLVLCMISGSLIAADWDLNDDTFDPTIHSVNVGDATWLGDPSPFVHTGLRRTGYTHVNPTVWEGFDPSVQISLMVPLQPEEKTPPATGMLMMNKSQTIEFIKVFQDAAKAESKDKGQRFLQLENKTKDKIDTYRFSINASKKLIGAIQHSLKKVKPKTD